MSSDASLDNLNPKQLQKEYKTVAKSIKNKDDDVKRAALDKLLRDHRYMIDGGCILPLLEIIQPKKKSLDFSLVALESLLKFLAPRSIEDGGVATEADRPTSSANPGLDAIQTVYKLSNEEDATATPSLHAFHIIADLIVYHDEVKKAKPVKVKKGETPPPVPKVYDSELSISLRSGGLHALYLLVQSLAHDQTGLGAAFARIPGITINLCDKLCACAKILIPGANDGTQSGIESGSAAVDDDAGGEDEVAAPTAEPEPETPEDVDRKTKAHSAALQETEWALMSLGVLLRHSAEACQILLKSRALLLLPNFAVFTKAFVQPVLNVIDALSLQCEVPEGDINGLFTIAQNQYWNILLEVASNASKALSAAASAPVAAAPAVAAAPPAKGAKGAPAPEPVVEAVKAEPKPALDSELLYLQTVVRILTHVATEQAKHSALGIITAGNVEALLRSVYITTTMPFVWELARSGHTHLPRFIDDACEMLGKLALAGEQLRVCVCSTGGVGVLLKILQNSAQIKADTPGSGADGSVSGPGEALVSLRRKCEQAVLCVLTMPFGNIRVSICSDRWEACGAYCTDEDYFSSMPARSEVEGEAATESFGQEFQRLLQGLLVDSEADTDLPDRAARVLCALVGSSNDFVAFLRDVLRVSPAMTRSIALLGSRRAATLVQMRGSYDRASVSSVRPDLLWISVDEALYCYLSLLDKLFAVSAEHAQAFSATENNVKLLSDVILAAGPTCSDNQTLERSAFLYDPHQQQRAGATSAESEERFLRPLVFDVLASLAERDGTKAQAALIVCRLCIDACVATLSNGVGYDATSDAAVRIYCGVHPTLETTVLNAGLRCLHSMASSGREGLRVILSVIAASPQNRSADSLPCGAASHFMDNLERLSGENYTASEYFRSSAAAVSSSPWAAPNKFSDILTADSDELSNLPNAMVNLAQRPALWPFVTVLAPLVYILRNPRFSSKSAELAANACVALCREAVGHMQQDLLFDICDAVFVSLGGAIALLASSSIYGNISRDAPTTVAAFVSDFLVSRGSAYPIPENGSAEESGVAAAAAAAPVVAAAPADKKGAAAAAAPVVVETAPVVPSEGLTVSFWSRLLDIWGDDLHQNDSNCTALLTSIRGGLAEQAIALVANGADVNRSNNYRITPLMYALLMGQESVVEALLAAGADVDATDADGNPAIKYAFSTINFENVQSIVQACKSPSFLSNSEVGLVFFGASPFVERLVSAGVDLLANDSLAENNNSAVHFCVGLGKVDLYLGGQRCIISPGAYSEGGVVSLSTVCETMQVLLSKGNATANQCNRELIVPLHIAAARGHVELMRLLYARGAMPNVRDCNNFLPIHHCCCCCPAAVIETLDLALQFGQHAPTTEVSYDSSRPELSSATSKWVYDVDRALGDIFRQATAPPSLFKVRNTFETLATSCTKGDESYDAVTEGFNILQLLLAGHVLQVGTCWKLNAADAGKERRLAAAVTLLTRWQNLGEHGTGTEATARVAAALIMGPAQPMKSFTTLHAAALLLQGLTPRSELSDAQKRSKRVKSFESEELHLWHLLYSGVGKAGMSTSRSLCNAPGHCSGLLGNLCNHAGWTPLHAAIMGSNVDVIADIAPSYVESCTDDELKEIISLLLNGSSSPSRYSLASINTDAALCILNINLKRIEGLRPDLLLAACQGKSVALVDALVASPRWDVNRLDPYTQETVFTTLVREVIEQPSSNERNMLGLLEPAAGRLDWFAGSGKYNVIDMVLEALHVPLLMFLLDWGKFHVINRVCEAKCGSGRSWLLHLEESNMDVANKLRGVPTKVWNSDYAATAAQNEAGEGGVAEYKEQLDDAAVAFVESVALTDEERQALDNQLQRSNAVLRLILDSGINDVIAQDCHAHKCFYEGVLYSDVRE